MLGFTEMEGGGNQIPPADFKKVILDERGISIPSTGVGYDELVKSPDSIIYQRKNISIKICDVCRLDTSYKWRT